MPRVGELNVDNVRDGFPGARRARRSAEQLAGRRACRPARPYCARAARTAASCTRSPG